MIRALACVLALALGGAADAACRQALALGLDVSGSVDAREYRLQINGLAAALDNIAVRDALLSSPGVPVSVMVYEWSGPSDQAVIAPWAVIENAATLNGLIETLLQTTRRDVSPGTALGTAITLGAHYLDQQPGCWKRTLDISGDGMSNLGPRPRDVKDAIGARGITVNALVIGADATVADPSESNALPSYFRAEVITGPDAFVETALGFEDYEAAMTRKLLRELEVLAVSELVAD
ncbi:Protein of unknown function [Sulfitobacter marinus]|uniref:VWFA domain-containing protein n=1 Tax=Sulfitobacter marinus TaxID=394264 RepID=A0A1I6PIQ2_9RHOB|nr:DUF1194 domain-containing protein [Sulfitobacter marinus]SFS40111.1 Protein of unknown function [Sulfitobacter marinus]